MNLFFCFVGTWQTYIVQDQNVWHKINKESPMEYAATIIVNPLTALRMLEDFTTLSSGTATSIFQYLTVFLLLDHFYDNAVSSQEILLCKMGLQVL